MSRAVGLTLALALLIVLLLVPVMIAFPALRVWLTLAVVASGVASLLWWRFSSRAR